MTYPGQVEAFEGALASRLGHAHVVSVTYARLGLRFLLEALGVRPGDEVILSALTCRVVVLAIQSAGFRPRYADLLPSGSLNMNAASVAARLTSRTRAIVFQHTFGIGSGLDAITDLAQRQQIPLIEDCAHCLPPATGGQGAGRRGIASIWSHNFRKPLPVGAGGCVATPDQNLATAIRRARDTARGRSAAAELQWRLSRMAHRLLLRPVTYWPLWTLNRRLRGDHREKTLAQAIHEEVTSLPVRISDRQAEWGLEGLAHADARIDQANAVAVQYDSAVRELRTLGRVPDAVRFPLYYYPVLATNRKALLEAARRRRLELIAWPLSTPIYPIERNAELLQSEYEIGSCPEAEDRAGKLCGMPVDLYATRRRAGKLIDLLRDIDARVYA